MSSPNYNSPVYFIKSCEKDWSYIFGGGGGNRTRVRRYCHLNIYKLIPYFKSHFLYSYVHDQKSQSAFTEKPVILISGTSSFPYPS